MKSMELRNLTASLRLLVLVINYAGCINDCCIDFFHNMVIAWALFIYLKSTISWIRGSWRDQVVVGAVPSNRLYNRLLLNMEGANQFRRGENLCRLSMQLNTAFSFSDCLGHSSFALYYWYGIADSLIWPPSPVSAIT
ncbi:unnamed protein product [Soboliphyme baturini]|uniref:Secreted protein n=1 Tax=Soboliphyme baturini TaxID=241478 RepID=A0A183II22_9BILA|nr:unnamed protein product [Soboliphyme baturini]